MTPITIITLVVVALLTVVISGLTALSYRSCIKAFSMEVAMGRHDEEIKKEYSSKKKRKGVLLGLIGSYATLSLLLGLFVSGIVYKSQGNNFTFNNQTALVIKSGSMSDFYSEEYALEYGNDKHLQFDVGDICIFETPAEDLTVGDVYGYKHKDIIITHRLISITEEGYCQFRGDNNPFADGLLVKRENILYHYTGSKISGIGSFILYAQSYFGIWSLVSIIGISVVSEVVYRKVDKISRKRLEAIENEK